MPSISTIKFIELYSKKRINPTRNLQKRLEKDEEQLEEAKRFLEEQRKALAHDANYIQKYIRSASSSDESDYKPDKSKYTIGFEQSRLYKV